MFILLDIEILPDDPQGLPAGTCHKLTFKVVYTIKDVPDSFTGVVYETASGELKLEHFNRPRGNRRKIITLKNKLAAGAFKNIEQCLFAKARGETPDYPQQYDTIKPKRRTPGR